MQIEVCANSFRSALEAMKGGAQRVELCQNLELGGTTPSPADIRLTIEHLHAKAMAVFVLIRPRSGDFVYTKEEIEVMKQDILFCKNEGADGVVIGALTPDFEIDLPLLEQLTDLAQPMEVTFHRAFDLINDPFLGLEQLIELNIHRVLTSGQEETAMQGSRLIKQLIQKADGRIGILPGSGIHSGNILELQKLTGATEFHLSAKHKLVGATERSGRKVVSESNYFMTDREEVSKVVRLVRGEG